MNNANNIEVVVSVPSRGNGVIDFCTGAFHALANGFRPLSGKWGYRSELSAECRELLESFRPLSGKWGYR